MPQSYVLTDSDQRTLGDLIQRVGGELHRPDLLNQVPEYIRDAVRFYSRHPFFFNQIDNSDVKAWQASVQVTRGYTILQTASDGNKYIFIALTSGQTGATQPTFTPTLFAFSGQSGVLFTVGQVGTTTDNQVTWATKELWDTTKKDVTFFWTQLSTLPTINQYDAPIDYAHPRLVELTAAGLRYPLWKNTYPKIRGWDVVRPAPVTVYPTEWSWFQKKIYLWPYPNGFFPITLSYYTAPFPPKAVGDSNFWTTTAEALIRNYAKARMNAEIIRDNEAALTDMQITKQEFDSLKLQEVLQESTSGIPPSGEWGAY